MQDQTITIERRFQGIPDVALGGYVGGLLAGGREAGEVALRRPVPLDRALHLERRGDGSATLLDGEDVLAAWKAGAAAVEVPFAVSIDEARAAGERSLQRSGEYQHPFPRCLVCGSDRESGDGLRVFAGPVGGKPAVAAVWTPERAHAGADGNVLPELTWAVLDCPTIMALVFASPREAEEAVVTVRFAVSRRGAVRAGEPHVVLGWSAGRDGKAHVTHGAVLSADGTPLVLARHALVPASWGVALGLDRWRRAQRP